MIANAYFARFDTPKYRDAGPVQRALIRRFVARLHGLFLEALPAESVLEVGVGEGFISGFLSERHPSIRFTGIDASAEEIEHLRREFPRVAGRVGSAYELGGLPGEHDLVVCAEVLEHLDAPERALDAMLALRPKRLLFSVPHEPFFRLSNLARGRNVARFGNDPGHLNRWGIRSFRKLLESRLDVLRLTTSYPWILALTAPR